MNRHMLLLDIQPGERALSLVTTLAAQQESTHSIGTKCLSLFYCSAVSEGNVIASTPEPEVEKLKLDVETLQVSAASNLRAWFLPLIPAAGQRVDIYDLHLIFSSTVFVFNAFHVCLPCSLLLLHCFFDLPLFHFQRRWEDMPSFLCKLVSFASIGN